MELRCSNKIIKILEGKVKNNLIHSQLKILLILLDQNHLEVDLQVQLEVGQALEDVVLLGSLQSADLSFQQIQDKWCLLRLLFQI